MSDMTSNSKTYPAAVRRPPPAPARIYISLSAELRAECCATDIKILLITTIHHLSFFVVVLKALQWCPKGRQVSTHAEQIG